MGMGVTRLKKKNLAPGVVSGELVRSPFPFNPSLSTNLLFPSLPVEVWAFRFAAECVADVAARTLTAEAPTYPTIMELDKKVREFPLPDGMEEGDDDEAREGGDMAGSFQRCLLAHIKETSKLRPFTLCP